jgi:ribosomal-protein-alanine N-acetyltransferase
MLRDFARQYDISATSNDISPPPMKIRDATRRDLPGIVEVERLAFDNPWSLDAFQRELSLPFSRLNVATQASAPAARAATKTADRTPAPVAGHDAGLIGFLCRWLVVDECHILNVAVHPQMRRQGIGKRLMQHALAEARAKDAHVITLEVRRSNLAARSLYRKLEFQERRLRRNYYGQGEDAIVMELMLI